MLALLHIQSGDEDLVGAKTGEVLTITPAARRLFSYVPQGNTMFSGTIAENMRNVRPDATDEEIKEVLIVSCAWEFVQKLPDGIYSKVGEDSQKDRHRGFQSQGHCFAVRRSCFWMRRQVHLMLQPSAGF